MTDIEKAEQAAQYRANLADKLVVKHAESGGSTLVIPSELFDDFNVVAPRAVMMGDAPEFKPSVTIVRLDPERDFYPFKGKKAPNKSGLGQLRQGAGITFPADVQRFGEAGEPQEVEIGERTMRIRPYTYTAVGRYRQHDGTWAEQSATTEWNPLEALLRIETQVSSGANAKQPGTVSFDNEVRSRFLDSMKYRAPMLKSKAQNAVIRTLLYVEQAYTTADAAKPFLVVGFYYAPEHRDPRITAALLGASTNALYGDGADTEGLSLPAPAEPDDEMPAEMEQAALATGAEDVPFEPTEAEDAAEQEALDEDAPFPEPEPEPEPELPVREEASDEYGGVDPVTWSEACNFQVTWGTTYRDRRLIDIATGEDGITKAKPDYLEWMIANMGDDPGRAVAVECAQVVLDGIRARGGEV